MASRKKTANAEVSEETARPIAVPEFTIRADSEAGMAVMVAAYHLSLGLPAEQRHAIAAKMREFELYEEATRG